MPPFVGGGRFSIPPPDVPPDEPPFVPPEVPSVVPPLAGWVVAGWVVAGWVVGFEFGSTRGRRAFSRTVTNAGVLIASAMLLKKVSVRAVSKRVPNFGVEDGLVDCIVNH